jgi:hypothetical protein
MVGLVHYGVIAAQFFKILFVATISPFCFFFKLKKKHSPKQHGQRNFMKKFRKIATFGRLFSKKIKK